MLHQLREYVDFYSHETFFAISYVYVAAKYYVNSINLTPVYELFAQHSLAAAAVIFPGVDVVSVLHSFYASYVVFPFTQFFKALNYAVESYFSCFDTDFCTKLNTDLTIMLCEVLDKPYQANKSLSFLLGQASITPFEGFNVSPTTAEVFHILNVFSATVAVVLSFLYVVVYVLAATAITVNFVFKVLTGYAIVSDDKHENALFLFESEKELGSIDDFIFILLALALVYTLYLGFFFAYSIGFEATLSVISVFAFPLLFTAIISMPINLLYDCGAGFVAYLRGSGNTTMFLLEFMYDSLATSIMFIRLFIQNVRFLLIFFAYFELFEFLDKIFMLNEQSWAYFQGLSSNVEVYSQQGGLAYYLFLEIPAIFIHGIYILGHLFYTFASNFACYIILLFWFFSFLYTMFYLDTLEAHYRHRRALEARRYKNRWIR